MRSKTGKDQRIPGVLMCGGQRDPVMISLTPGAIQRYVEEDHFLGRRYTLTIDSTTVYSVYPTHLEVNPVNFFPMSVCFSIWNGKPRILWTPKQREHYRPWEKGYIKRLDLMTKLRDINRQYKEEVKRIPKIGCIGWDEEEVAAIYGKKDPGVRYLTFKEEMETEVLSKYWYAPDHQVLLLEKEEMNRDEPMQDEVDEDEEEG